MAQVQVADYPLLGDITNKVNLVEDAKKRKGTKRSLTGAQRASNLAKRFIETTPDSSRCPGTSKEDAFHRGEKTKEEGGRHLHHLSEESLLNEIFDESYESQQVSKKK